VEVIPFESKNVFEVHQILLPMSGTYILENMNTAPLAADNAYEFRAGRAEDYRRRAEHHQSGGDPLTPLTSPRKRAGRGLSALP
jgi:hypothetical protein